MGKFTKNKTPQQRANQMKNLAKNKIKAIEKALKFAKGDIVGKLKERLAYWQKS